MKVSCEVIAPSLIPTAPGERVKTDLLTELLAPTVQLST